MCWTDLYRHDLLLLFLERLVEGLGEFLQQFLGLCFAVLRLILGHTFFLGFLECLDRVAAGIAQAERLRGQNLFADCLFVSPLLRARQTAEIVFPQMPYALVEGLRETDFGRFEGKNADELSSDSAYQAWVDAMCLTPIPGGEAVADFKKRCCKAFAETIAAVPDGMCAAFVVHGGVIMAVLEFFAYPKRDFYAYHIGNGECLACTYDGQTLRVKSIAR